jgi:hypothetical protein
MAATLDPTRFRRLALPPLTTDRPQAPTTPRASRQARRAAARRAAKTPTPDGPRH